MRLYMPRFYTRSLKENLEAMRRDVNEAATQRCDAILFPEVFLTGYHGEGDAAELHKEFATLSGQHSEMLMAFGTVSEGGFNRMPIYSSGQKSAHYDKVHLFEPNGEHEFWKSGSSYAAFRYGSLNIGMVICNDIRFPEQARALKLSCDVGMLFVPALWPWQRDHIWSTLLRARAIENGCFVAGCCVAGVDNGSMLFDGAGNHVYDPLGNEIHPDSRVYDLDLPMLGKLLVDTRSQYREINDVELLDG